MTYLKRVSMALGKSSKLACLLTSSPYLILPNRFMPMMAYMNMKRPSTVPTLNRAGSDLHKDVRHGALFKIMFRCA